MRSSPGSTAARRCGRSPRACISAAAPCGGCSTRSSRPGLPSSTTQRLPQPMLRRGSQLDAYETADHRTCWRAIPISRRKGSHEELRRLGYQGRLQILLCQRVQIAASPADHPPRETVRDRTRGFKHKWITPLTTLISLIEGRRRVHAFSYVLGYSRRQYLHFVEARICHDHPRAHPRVRVPGRSRGDLSL